MAVNKFFWTAVLSFDAVYLPVLLLVQNKRKKLTQCYSFALLA